MYVRASTYRTYDIHVSDPMDIGRHERFFMFNPRVLENEEGHHRLIATTIILKDPGVPHMR